MTNETLKQVNFQRKVTKIGDSLYVRIGIKELDMIGNPGIVDVTVKDASEEVIEIECPQCHEKITVNENEDVFDCQTCDSELISSEVIPNVD